MYRLSIALNELIAQGLGGPIETDLMSSPLIFERLSQLTLNDFIAQIGWSFSDRT